MLTDEQREAQITEFDAVCYALRFWRAALADAPAPAREFMREQIARLDARHAALCQEIELC
jgi:hypothetical protein